MTRKLVSCKGKLYELAHNALFNFWQELPDITVSNHDSLGFSWILKKDLVLLVVIVSV